MRAFPIASLFVASLFIASSADAQWWTVQSSGFDTNLRAVSAAWSPDSKAGPVPVVWAAGSNGVILRSIDEGKSWKRLHISGGDALDFRGIAALDADVAYVISIGNGDKSRIYKTTDAGLTWTLQFGTTREEIFLDAIVCETETYCIVLGDPIDSKFLLMSTQDGAHWKDLPRDNLPVALSNEGAFAASNSSLCLDDQNIYFGTGGAARARIFHSPDDGRSWMVTDTPVAAGNASSGIFSLDCKGGRVLHAVGGDYNDSSPLRFSMIPLISRAKPRDGGCQSNNPAAFAPALLMSMARQP